MGTQQQFCLRWNNHQSNMLSVFDDLFQNEALVDVTLACEGLSIKAHKMVLSACSPYFQSLFLDNPCKHPIVILKDVRFADLKALMDFMYKGEVNVSQEQLSTLLKTAETLKVRGLTEVAGNANDIHNSILTQQPGLTHHLPPPRSGGAPQLQPQPLPAPPQLPIRSSPSPKRRKVQDRHRSEPSSSQSEHEDSDSHELIEPKVEITEEAVNDERSSDLVTKNTPSSLARTGQSVDFHSNSSQGLSSAQAASPTSDQNFSARSSSLSSQNATPPQLYNPSAPVSVQPPIASVQTIGQPPVLQGTSQGRERQIRRWNEATLAEAMEAVRSKKMSIIAACRQYEIPWGTLYRRLSLANIRSPYARNEPSYTHFLNTLPSALAVFKSPNAASDATTNQSPTATVDGTGNMSSPLQAPPGSTHSK